MAIQTLNTIKKWFRTGLKPTQTQFWDTWDSFRHKCEKIPLEDIKNTDQLIGQKIIPSGEFLIFKITPNTTDELEIGDSVIGYCEGNFLAEATYYGGDTNLMNSFEPITEAVIENITLSEINSYNGTNLFYNNIENRNGIIENTVRYLNPDYSYLDPIFQGAIPSPYNSINRRVSGLKLAEFMIMNSNTINNILSENPFLLFQLTMNVTAGESPATLRPRLYLAGSLTNQFEAFESSYRLIEYSNNGTYRETDLESNWLGEWETLVRIKTKYKIKK